MSPPKAERFGISADGDLAVAKRINAMSQHLAPLYVPIAEANQALAGWGNTHKTLARLEVAAKIYNRALDQLIPELAQLTIYGDSDLFRGNRTYSSSRRMRRSAGAEETFGDERLIVMTNDRNTANFHLDYEECPDRTHEARREAHPMLTGQ